MISVSADVSGISKYVGGIGGVLDAVESPQFEGDFASYTLGKLRDKFRAETIASHMAGNKRIDHVFEWKPEGQGTGNIPLFALYKTGVGGMQTLSYKFLPSMEEVPLPDPAKYGFDPGKLSLLSRHVFRMKALVMETQSSVLIDPKGDSKLFIPDASKRKGYYMSSNTSNINPGGSQATGGFAEWWNSWFEVRAPEIVLESTHLAEQIIANSSRKVVRYAAGTTKNGKKVGGQFASGTTIQVAYVEAAQRNAKAWTLMEARGRFDSDTGEWEKE